MAISLVDTGLSDAVAVTIPALAAAGDLGLWFTYGFTTSSGSEISSVSPSGWTQCGIAAFNSGIFTEAAKGQVFYRILQAGDPNTAVNGLDSAGEANILYVFRSDQGGIVSVSPTDWAGEATNGNPASNAITASGAATYPVIVAGVIGSNATNAEFSTASPAFDAEIETTSGRLNAGYKIYASGASDHTIDAGDLGNCNVLIGGYLQITEAQGQPAVKRGAGVEHMNARRSASGGSRVW